MTEQNTVKATHWVLTIVCADQPGIVHAISGAIVQAGGNITESHQFSSHDTHQFFVRLQVESMVSRAEFADALTPVIDRYGMTWNLDVVGRPLRTLVLVSTAAHCLNDMLFRERAGQLPVHIPLVLSNHETLHSLANFYGVPFEAHPVTSPGQKLAFEDRIIDAVEQHDIELVVLARYMQILSPELCDRLSGRMINIHHSFLPGFKGANPYRQAHQRGVKLIGATAHFVTSDLDEGPIIEQNVVRVDHSRTPGELVAIGQDEESRTLNAGGEVVRREPGAARRPAHHHLPLTVWLAREREIQCGSREFAIANCSRPIRAATAMMPRRTASSRFRRRAYARRGGETGIRPQ